PAAFVLIEAKAKEAEGHDEPANEHGKSHRWIVKFFCEAKAADIALVFFTYGLMVVTGWLAWATLKLWRAGEKQMELVAEANRISHATMVADQRPGITANDLQLVNDLNFYNWGADFVMNVKFTNIGKSAASRIRVHMERRKSSEGLRDAIERLAESEKDDESP